MHLHILAHEDSANILDAIALRVLFTNVFWKKNMIRPGRSTVTGGHQSAVSDDVNLATESLDPEHGHRHAIHGRGQIGDGAEGGDAG